MLQCTWLIETTFGARIVIPSWKAMRCLIESAKWTRVTMAGDELMHAEKIAFGFG
jgi:hypothetical protein